MTLDGRRWRRWWRTGAYHWLDERGDPGSNQTQWECEQALKAWLRPVSISTYSDSRSPD